MSNYRSYCILFHNDGGATLQHLNRQIAVFYYDMAKLASDVKELELGSDPIWWDGQNPSDWVADEEADPLIENGGIVYLSFQESILAEAKKLSEKKGWINIDKFHEEYSK